MDSIRNTVGTLGEGEAFPQTSPTPATEGAVAGEPSPVPPTKTTRGMTRARVRRKIYMFERTTGGE